MRSNPRLCAEPLPEGLRVEPSPQHPPRLRDTSSVAPTGTHKVFAAWPRGHHPWRAPVPFPPAGRRTHHTIPTMEEAQDPLAPSHPPNQTEPGGPPVPPRQATLSRHSRLGDLFHHRFQPGPSRAITSDIWAPLEFFPSLPKGQKPPPCEIKGALDNTGTNSTARSPKMVV